MTSRRWITGVGILLAWLGLVPLWSFAKDEDSPEPSPAAGQMLESMREKGILSQEEYQDLYRRQAIYEVRQREASQLPGWIRDWTFGGDFRLRWERIHSGSLPLNRALDPDETPVDSTNGRAIGTRERGRMLLRLGAERRVGENFVVGFRLATSQDTTFGSDANPGGTSVDQSVSGDPRSMNTTFGDYFSPKKIFVDRAYVRFAPTAVPTLRITAGKMANPYVSEEFPADFLVWDPDIQAEGASAEYSFNLIPERARLDLKGSYSFIDEVGAVSFTKNTNGPPEFPDFDEADPYMYGMQAGLTFDPKPWFRFGGRVSYYDLRDLDARFAAASADLGNGKGAIEHNALFFLDGETSPFFEGRKFRGRMQEMVYDGFVRLSFGDWDVVPFAQTTELLNVTGGENRGYSLGLQLNAPFGTKLTFLYANVERNGTIALFTDSDLFDGFTNAKGYYVALQHPITPHVSVRGAFFSSSISRADCKAGQKGFLELCDTGGQPEFKNFRKRSLDRHRVQVDLRVIF